AVRIGVERMVEDVARFHPRLDPALSANRERAEEREVEVVAARPVELVAAGVAEAHAGRLRERRRIEPLAGGADVAEDVEAADQAGTLRVAGGVERGAAGSARDGLPVKAANTPLTCQSPKIVLITPWS